MRFEAPSVMVSEVFEVAVKFITYVNMVALGIVLHMESSAFAIRLMGARLPNKIVARVVLGEGISEG